MNESQMIYVIQYDGLSYGEHTIDLASLGGVTARVFKSSSMRRTFCCNRSI